MKFPLRSAALPAIALLLFGSHLAAAAQTANSQSPSTPPPAGPTLPPPHGTVLFERHTQPDGETAAPAAQPSNHAAEPPADAQLSGSALSDADRSALTVTRYDLDARLVPAAAQLEMRARLTVRNDATTPLTRIALQISSTLKWQSATLLGPSPTRLPLVQHLLQTDTDHTGSSNELVLTLPQPLAPGQSLALDTFYSGNITADSGRLERIGATQQQALTADWDAITPALTALRGFGNVLWIPAASPQLFLGDQAHIFQAIARARLRQQDAEVRLHLAIAYNGEPPAAAYFCGRRQPLKAVSDDSDSPVATGSGIATADFPQATLGFRPVSLFVLADPETLSAPLSTTPDGTPSAYLLSLETHDTAAVPLLDSSAKSLAPLLETWFGPHPLSTLTVIDHDGQPFEDGPLLVAPVAALGSSSSAPALAHSLTHAWVQTGQPWMDEGLAQFLSLLSIEQEHDRDAATAALNELMQPVALAEPPPQALTSDTSGQPLIAASDELYYRRKAAAVWWMLRSIVGDQALQIALTTLASQPPSSASSRDQAVALQKLLERTSHKDLAWFFNDWVLRDRGLPDLSITDVTPRQLSEAPGHSSGWLVAVSVQNEGGAAAEVPLIVRSGTYSVTRTVRVPGLSSITERVLVEARPTQVLLNDGSTPEVSASTHTLNVTVQTAP